MISLIPPEKPVFRIIAREEWAGDECRPRHKYTPQKPKALVIHHTYSPNSKQFRGIESVRGIYRYHTGPEKKWSDIGYHWLISPDGIEIYECRPANAMGAHCGSKPPVGVRTIFDNEDTIGICLAGNYDIETPQPGALKTLGWLIADQCEKWSIKLDQIFGHCQAWSRPPKTCPGKNLFVSLFGLARWEAVWKKGK